MTNKEAIDILRNTHITIGGGDIAHLNYSKAIEKAIEALEKQEPTAFDKDGFYLFLNDWALAVSPNGWEDDRTREIKRTKADTIHEVMQALDDLK